MNKGNERPVRGKQTKPMTHHIKTLITAGLLAMTALAAEAQTNGSNSPYSRYGYGLLGDEANAFSKGMAGTALGMRNGTELNTKNPASYSAIDSLTFLFDLGMSFQNGNIAQGGLKTNARNTSIDYITAGFRISPRVGMALGMVPYSTVGYETSTTTETPQSETLDGSSLSSTSTTSTRSGDGGLHEVMAGVGYEPLRGLSVGLNVGYLWGTLKHSSSVSTTNQSTTTTSTQGYYADIRTYKVDLGLQYDVRIDKKNLLTVGLTYGLGHPINRTAYFYNTVNQSDTISCKNAFELPHTFGLGLTWSHNRTLRVGADYTFQKWGGVKFPTLSGNEYVSTTGQFCDRHKVSVGAEYVPGSEALRWSKRIRYRAGFSYASPYQRIAGEKGPSSYLASVGVALPVITMYNNRTFLNLGLAYERVQPHSSSLIKENYIRVSIGLTFNERWFMKWKAE